MSLKIFVSFSNYDKSLIEKYYKFQFFMMPNLPVMLRKNWT